MRTLVITVFFFFFGSLAAQRIDSVPGEAKTLNDVFKASKLDIQARSMFMATQNQGSLTDDQAWGSALGVGFQTKVFRGWQVGMSGMVIYNHWSTNLKALDPITNAPNRYEIGLFDVQELEAKQHLTRMETLFLRYQIHGSKFTLGKMKLNSPFINAQDGRLNTTLVEGLWWSHESNKKLQMQAGLIWGISPRSTQRWYSVANSFGIYPMGVNENGTRSAYYQAIENSRGIAMVNIQYKPNERFKINVWNMMVENVINTAFLELNHESGTHWKFYQGLQYIHQNALADGGNRDQQKTYITRGSQSNVLSAQLGMRRGGMNHNISYTHITGDGRYLSPREWGRDPFYTFMMRERNDGFGNLHAFVAKTTVAFYNQALKASLAYGFFLLPDVKNYRLNKYGMPSYQQINLDLSYGLDKFMKGMTLRGIAAYKLKEGNTYENPKFVYNKVNMMNMTLMIDYKF